MPQLDLRELIQKQDDTVYENVITPEWKDEQGEPLTVKVRSLTSAELDKFEEDSFKGNGKKRSLNMQDMRARLVARAACKEDGTPLFRPSDVAWLSAKNGSAVQRLFEVAQRLSGLRDTDIEEIVKNSESGQSEDSGLS